MNIFGETFLNQLKEAIIKLVQDAVNILVEKEKPINQRYLNKSQAREYIGGIDTTEFEHLLAMGLKKIVITRPSGQTSVRYDIADLDEFMAKYRM